MKSIRSMHVASLCGALILLMTAQSGRDAGPVPGQLTSKREPQLTRRHDGLQLSQVDAFSYRPYARADRLATETPSATFQVTYNSAFPAQARAAFEYALAIWADILNSPVAIRINAQFINLAGQMVAEASPVGFNADFQNAPIPSTWFPDAVSDRLAGIDLFPSDFDIDATFDSTPPSPWYYGLDALPPAGQVDFVTVALHEIGHGLGFVGSAFVDTGLGYWGLEVPGEPGVILPVIYDRYTRAGGVPIINFTDGTASLASALTGGNLFFSSPIVTTDPAIAAPAKLYAPSTWDDVTSYNHLDEATFPPGNPNSLMTPTIATAEANHNPGPITREIFTDIGWGATGGGSLPGQPTVTSAVVSGSTLTVTWTSGSGGAPTSHRLDFYLGATLVASVPTGSATTANIPIPAGTVGSFGVRVIAINAAGAGPASALFTFGIGVNPPGQPIVTSAVASGGVLTVTWTSGAGAAPTTHRLDFYSGPTLVAQVTVGAATNTAIPIPPGIQGSFSVAVTAFSGAIPGPASAQFAFTIGSSCTVPAAPVVSGGVVGGTASANWQAVAGATSYIVSAGTTVGGAQYLPPTDVGNVLGVSASGLPSGFFAWVRVAAVNACNQQGPGTDFLVQ